MEKPSKQTLVAFFGKSDIPYHSLNFTEICRFVTRWMILNYDLYDARYINGGWCFIWAYLVWCLSPHEHKFKNLGGDGHVITLYSGRYYDSEHMSGVKRTSEFRWYGSGVKTVNIDEMCDYWLDNGFAAKLFKEVINKTQFNRAAA